MFLLFVGLATVAVTFATHAWATTVAMGVLTRLAPDVSKLKQGGHSIVLGGAAVFFGFKHYLDMVLWALVFWRFAGSEPFGDFGNAVYFSSVTYTSLGYGDFVLENEWRQICGIEAMNGIILFGWTTALIFVLVQKLWATESSMIVNEDN